MYYSEKARSSEPCVGGLIVAMETEEEYAARLLKMLDEEQARVKRLEAENKRLKQENADLRARLGEK